MTAFTVNFSKKHGVKIFRDIQEMSGVFFDLLVDEFTSALAEKKTYHLVLSGGSTPVKIFENLARMPVAKMKWDFLHIYWGDERCVPPDDQESNYGSLWKTIIRYIDIPEENIHRISGEADPEAECKRYSEELIKYVPQANNLPVFDLVLLGIGEDGHTASIFPDALEMLDTNQLCYVVRHPQTLQKRITLSLNVINNSRSVIFLATGLSKAAILAKILKRNTGFEKLPASYVNPLHGQLSWYLDKDSGKELKRRFFFF